MFEIALTLLLALPPGQPTTDNRQPNLGYSALHLESNKRMTVRGNESFPMGSVYKFPIGVSVLKRIDAKTWSADEKITITKFSPGWSPLREEAKGKPITVTLGRLLELMVRDSDNTPCDYFLEKIGASVVTKEIGAPGIRIDRQERVIAADIHRDGRAKYATDIRDTATPDAMAAYLTKFWRRELGLSNASHELLVRLMTETKTGPKRMKSALPPGATLAHKTGTMPGTVNDVGVITTASGQHVVIAFFTKGGSGDASGQERLISTTTRDILTRLLDNQ